MNKKSPEEKAECERYEQARWLLNSVGVFDADPRKPGDLIRRVRSRITRIAELKPHHFNNLISHQ